MRSESVNVDDAVGTEDPNAPRAALASAATDMERIGRGLGSRDIERALREVRWAQSAFSDTTRGLEPTNLTATTPPLVAAQRALASAAVADPTRRELDAVATRLDAAARRIADDLLALAAQAGADRRTVSSARVELARGDRLVQAGKHADAAAAFGKVLKISGNGIVFDIARFEQNIRSTFDSQTTGYSYSIVRKGLLYSAKGVGLALTPTDSGGVGDGIPHSPTREVNIASVTKTVTAAAVLKLLRKNKIDINESVAPFLPTEWEVHPSIEDLTYKDLLTQRSGLGANKVGGSTSLATLQDAFKKGIKPADKTFKYQNANFGIFRVIIPELLGVNIYGDPDKPADVVAAETYVNYLQTQVFDQEEPVPDCKPNEELVKVGLDPANAYAFPDDGKPGVETGDWSLDSGGGGLYMSATELGQFLARLRYTDEILSSNSRKLMNDNFLGYQDPANSYNWNDGTFGVYRSHGGRLNYGKQGIESCATDFPIAVQAAILINSIGGNYGKKCAALAQAFESAWVAK